jgi:hypothetical protein
MLSQFYADVIQFRFFEAHPAGDTCHICPRRGNTLVYLQKEIELISVTPICPKRNSACETRSLNFQSKG